MEKIWLRSTVDFDLAEDIAQAVGALVEVHRRQGIKRVKDKVPRVCFGVCFDRPDEQVIQIALVLVLAVERPATLGIAFEGIIIASHD